VLAVIAFNLTRATATFTRPQLARATTGTIRGTLIAVPARIACSTRHRPQWRRRRRRGRPRLAGGRR